MEQEIELIFRGDKAPLNHQDDDTSGIYPHEYLDREITGTLRPLHLQLLKALIASVEKGELKPLFARRSLAGEIDPVRTWIETDHLLNWCEERDLYLDYCFDEYVGGERRVEEATFHTASSEREQLESRTIREQAAEKFSGLSEDQTLAYAVKLMADNAVLRRELDNKQTRPLERERNVLHTRRFVR